MDDQHHQFAVAYLVHDAIVADADAQPALLPSQCLYAVRPGLSAQGFGGVLDAARYLTVKLAELATARPGGTSARGAGRSLVVGDAEFGPDLLGRDVIARLGQGGLSGGHVSGVLGRLDLGGGGDDRG